MGWRFRRSIGRGPLRLNFSRHGVGASFGVRGLRVGRSSTGRSYFSAGLPGTGIGYTGYSRRGHGGGCAGCLMVLLLIFAAAVVWSLL